MEKKKVNESDDNVYDNEKVEEQMDNDEIEPQEAGFMEGYNEKQSEKPKKSKDIIQSEK